MANYIVTVRMLRKNPHHNPHNKIAGSCPVTGGECTDTTGEHHSFVVRGARDEDEVRGIVSSWGTAQGFRLTRMEMFS